MDMSSPRHTRTAAPVQFAVEHAAAVQNGINRNSARARSELMQAAAREKIRELGEAYNHGLADGREDARTEHWIAGAKVGAFCGLLLGLAVGAAGAIFWAGLGVAAR